MLDKLKQMHLKEKIAIFLKIVAILLIVAIVFHIASFLLQKKEKKMIIPDAKNAQLEVKESEIFNILENLSTSLKRRPIPLLK